MKVYVSIPITGKDYEEQKELAYHISKQLALNGHDAITPFDVVKSSDTPYNEAMGMCIAALLECDGIYLCKGWENSKGCKAECRVAQVYDKTFISF